MRSDLRDEEFWAKVRSHQEQTIERAGPTNETISIHLSTLVAVGDALRDLSGWPGLPEHVRVSCQVAGQAISSEATVHRHFAQPVTQTLDDTTT